MDECLEIDYLFMRAEEEAIRAIHSHCKEASAVHFAMSLRYGLRARAALLESLDDARPRFAEFTARMSAVNAFAGEKGRASVSDGGRVA